MELKKLDGGEEQQGASHEHGGADGDRLAARPTSEAGERVHEFDGLFVGGVALVIHGHGGQLDQG